MTERTISARLDRLDAARRIFLYQVICEDSFWYKGITGSGSNMHAEHVSFWYYEEAQFDFPARGIWAGARQCRVLILRKNALLLAKDLENSHCSHRPVKNTAR